MLTAQTPVLPPSAYVELVESPSFASKNQFEALAESDVWSGLDLSIGPAASESEVVGVPTAPRRSREQRSQQWREALEADGPCVGSVPRPVAVSVQPLASIMCEAYSACACIECEASHAPEPLTSPNELPGPHPAVEEARSKRALKRQRRKLALKGPAKPVNSQSRRSGCADLKGPAKPVNSQSRRSGCADQEVSLNKWRLCRRRQESHLTKWRLCRRRQESHLTKWRLCRRTSRPKVNPL